MQPDFFTQALWDMPLWAAALCALGWNIVIFVVCLVAGDAAVRRLTAHRIAPEPPQITAKEVALAVSCVFLNTAVTVAGMVLWHEGIIRLQDNAPWRVVVDSLILFFVMDAGMYALHRLAHHPLLFALIHRTHHQYESPRPLTLFVLNPMEVLGFGGLWLLVITLYPASSLGIVIYLTLNVVFGLVGHLGVEPMPLRWLALPGLRQVSTSTFHAEHHLGQKYNFGFYTLIWDRLFGTLAPQYREEFTRAATA